MKFSFVTARLLFNFFSKVTIETLHNTTGMLSVRKKRQVFYILGAFLMTCVLPKASQDQPIRIERNDVYWMKPARHFNLIMDGLEAGLKT